MPTRRLERVGGLALKATSGDKDSEKEEEKREKAKLEAGTERKKLEKEGLEPDSEEPSALAKEVVDLGRRTFVATLGVALITGYVNIYGDAQLNEFDSFLRRTFPDKYKKQRIRPQLQAAFAAALAEVYESVAVSDLLLLSADKLRADEAALAAKASSFFPGLKGIPPGTTNSLPLATLLSSEAGCNLALYARLHTIAGFLPSPKSRKDFGKRVGAKILTSNLVSGSFKLDEYKVKDPLTDFGVWIEGSKQLINAYTLGGFGLLTVGEKGIGELRAEDWLEDKRASFSLFVGDLALTDAAQVLAGEALDDMAAALLPSLPLVAYLERCGIQADAESYYMSSQYTRNPADYRPDGVAIQFNLEYAAGGSVSRPGT